MTVTLDTLAVPPAEDLMTGSLQPSDAMLALCDFEQACEGKDSTRTRQLLLVVVFALTVNCQDAGRIGPIAGNALQVFSVGEESIRVGELCRRLRSEFGEIYKDETDMGLQDRLKDSGLSRIELELTKDSVQEVVTQHVLNFLGGETK